MSEHVQSEVVVITGASAGVGRAVVREFARRGASIGLLARGADGLEAARREVEEMGGRGLVLPTDVADPAQVEAAAEAVEKEFGPIDLWVNNAMASVFAPFWKVTPEEFRRVTEVTYLGYVYGTMAALKRMMPRDRGTVLQVGSALAYRAIPLQSAYCGAKHAIVGFTESLLTELLHCKSNVQLRMVHLPGVNTPQFEWIRNKMGCKSQPVGTIFQPEVAARAIVWAATEGRRRELFVGWPTVKAVVGDKIAPSLADHYVAATVWDAHQSDEPEPPGRRDNLFEPVPGDHGAHGPYDSLSKDHSWQLWATTHRGTLALAGVGVAAAVLGTWLERRR